jgi:hypothetical protein
MGAIKFPHASGNSMSIAAPATNPASDLELKLPATVGTAGQVLKNSSSAGTLEFGTAGLFSSYAILKDLRTSAGGSFDNNAWRDRPLNTEYADPDGIVSITSTTAGDFTLASAGTYLIKWQCPAYDVGQHISKLRNTSDSADVCFSNAATAWTDETENSWSFGVTRVTIAASKTFRVQHYCETTSSSNGMGTYYGPGSESLEFLRVEIYKEI